ncbi:metallophosphoesterase [Paracoccus denitrificans]|jgi:UDP-2,3-diacylglucosamine pyrophosphatase LpxH|uniref:Metallophosphoesterase n=1 Tax=Paracoccus denitrificans (strain Pd 1222) TaxID=318586 RepID=A1B8K0_PARDP|nr:metallophosphoesterase [Paracoccus denitrificans]ABL71844.1 metallophosphoesterase [Paracoccus denitrificans PD1222]MBB4628049.1 UDP-2,3-diacylglucosamine pyrophosphatase LpxH [Paracoccus denitrificans]MCU7429118.1 metallophosphoesterase [Paracoccus denitrificans]QAR28431.1 hypothetical protein EO213_19205 [Paracoccus denitrificans]UPV96570.1 metallophosphoesterase [Paracoccus denitrificans]
MTVESAKNKAGPFNVTGTSGTFPRKFLLLDEDHLRVIRVRDGQETDLTTGIGHTGIGTADGTVVISAGIEPGDTIYLLRAVPNTQRSDYNDQGRVRPGQVESDLDLVVMQIQDVSERAERSLTLPVSSELGGEAAMQAALDAPGYAAQAQAAAAMAQAYGLGFQSREAFLAAAQSGILNLLPDGTAIHVVDRLYIRRAGSTTIPGLPGWDHPRTVHKSILTGDWQARLEYPAEIDAVLDVFDDMQRWHGDVDDICHVGDIVERATQHNTGDISAVYSYDRLLPALWARTALPRVYFIPGNHDSDGAGLTQHQYARSQHTYMDYIGRRFFTVRMGNLLRVFMGTMAGDGGGNIHTTTLYWFDQILQRNAGCNIEVYLHQPLYGYADYVEDSAAVQYKSVCDRIVTSLERVDNVAFVCSGHIARPEDLPNYYDAYGTRMFSVNMHIPRMTETGAPAARPYGVIEYRRGSNSAIVRMWNAATHSWLAGRDVPITYKYPLDLGAGVPDFDGRYAAQASWPSFDGVLQIQRDIRENSHNAGTPEAPNWTSDQGFRPGLRMVLMELGPDDAKAGDGLSIDWWVPASATVPDATDAHNDIAGNYLAGRGGVRREVGLDGNPTGELAFQLGTTGLVSGLRDVLTVRGSDGRAFAPESFIGNALPELGLLAALGLDNTLFDKGFIGENGNVNTLGEPGIYRIASGAVAATITGLPYTGSGGIFIVLNPAAVPSSRPVAVANQIQIWIARAVGDGGLIYYRVCNSGSWVSWRLISTTVV